MTPHHTRATCIDNAGIPSLLTVGHEYEITEVTPSVLGTFYRVLSDRGNGLTDSVYAWRFGDPRS